jgi:hypothetical protein
MKSLCVLVVLILISSVNSFSQLDKDKMARQRDRIHQLEKIKLIETLNLDEDTSVKFFARRNEMQNEVESLQDKSDDIINKLEITLDSSNNNSEATQKQLINELTSVRGKIENVKKQFIDSLNNILSTEKIARYLVFEQRFREEIRKIILDRRHRPQNQ